MTFAVRVATRGTAGSARRDRTVVVLLAGSAVAWVVLVAVLVTGVGMSAERAMAGMPSAAHAMTGMSPTDHAMAGMPSTEHEMGAGAHHGSGGVTAAWSAIWLVMVVAMMWPLWEAHVASTARRSRGSWKLVNAAAFVGILTACWFAFGVAVRVVLSAIPMPDPAVVWPLVALGAAAVLSRSLRRSRRLRRCGAMRAIAPTGLDGVTAAARNGAREWPRCLLLCGPLMAAMTVSHQPSLLVGATAASWWEERHAHTWQSIVPTVVLVTAMVVFVAGY